MAAGERAVERIDLGNGESLVRGVVRQNDGTYLALTFSRSRVFKTEAGARRWLSR